ncbi:MAG: phosphatidylglycerol lysyltransferase domain-containing protein [Actinomycetota bacterium]
MLPRAIRIGTAATLSAATIVAVEGWLYATRGVSWPGPSVRDALALDELPHRDAVPLLLYILVWAAASLLMALLGRWAGADGLTAGLLLGAAVGAWLYALNGVSIVVVRQISAHAAFHRASFEQAVILPAVIAGIVGAAVGRTRVSSRDRSRTVLAWVVGGVAVLAILDAMLPEHRHSLMFAFDPAHVHALTKALVVPLSGALLVAARALARGSRRGWQAAVGVLVVLLVLHVGRRFDEGALVTALTLVALVGRRGDFRRAGDPVTRRRIAVHALVAAAGVGLYGIVAIWLTRLMADQSYTVPFALKITGRALAGLSFRGADHLSGSISDWFPVSAFLLGWGSVAFVLVEWTAPWRYRLQQPADERGRAGRIVAAWGHDTLAPFALRADKSYFFADDEGAFLAYRVVGGVAIVAGDPIGPEEACIRLLDDFRAFAHDRGWRLAILGAGGERLQAYRSLGLRAVYHGDEAVVDTAAFSLDGRAIRKVRQSTHRLRNAGYTTKVLRPSEIDDGLRAELESIAAEWRGSQPERGFVMALDALFNLGDDDVVFVVGYDEAERPQGFLHFAVAHAGNALSLSSMPRRRSVPNGFVEWLVCASVEWARAVGYRRVSLNFAPFAAIFAGTELTVGRRVARAGLSRLKGWFQLDNLLQFNRKFFPEWQARYVVFERVRDLPRVSVAALAAESYLPFQ